MALAVFTCASAVPWVLLVTVSELEQPVLITYTVQNGTISGHEWGNQSVGECIKSAAADLYAIGYCWSPASISSIYVCRPTAPVRLPSRGPACADA